MASILIIEDEPGPRTLMSFVLRDAGHNVRAAASATEALDQLENFTPDLLLSDWLLDGETGYDVTLAVRQRVPGVRALFITGFPAESVYEQARRVSPWPILEKPVDIDALVRTVDQALESLNVRPRGEPRYCDTVAGRAIVPPDMRAKPRAGPGEPSMTDRGEAGSLPPIVLHLPHARVEIPDDIRPSLLLDEIELRRELIRMTDWYTDELFSLPSPTATPVIYGVSRLVLDPERFLDDRREKMAAKGMGVVYTRTSQDTPLRDGLSPAERQALIQRFYDPHHAELNRCAGAALDAHGWCLVIDSHSLPSHPLPFEPDQNPKRPDICIGTDEVHTPCWLRDLAHCIYKQAGFSVKLNRPFPGSLTPSEYERDRRVHSIMIELNRGLYLDETTGARLPEFSQFCTRHRQVLAQLIAAVQRHKTSATQ